VNEKMAQLAMSSSGSGPISEASRVGAALIMLGGGRRIEAMRTHGISSSQAYANFHRVCQAIVGSDQLKVEYDISLEGLKRRAKRFSERSSHALFKYCTDAIDGDLQILNIIVLYIVSYCF
jgi:hypothetical protein